KILNDNLLLIKEKGLNAVHNGIAASLAKMTGDKLLEEAKEMIDAESKLLAVRTQRFEYVYHVTLFTNLLTNFISLVMVGAFLHVLRLHLITRAKSEAG